jgi:hypothetical protein
MRRAGLFAAALGVVVLLASAAVAPGRAQQAARTVPPNIWVNMQAGGVAAGNGVGDEGWSTLVYAPGIKRAVVFGKYHAARAVSWGENQNALMGYDFATNTWDILEVTEAAWSEFLPGVGHDQGRVAVDPRRDLYITFGNMTLHGNTMYQTYIYDLRAGRGKRMLPSQEPRLGHEVATAFDPNEGVMLSTRGASWIYDPDKNIWSDVSGGPSDRAGPGLTYDTKHSVFVMFGGGESNETWTFETAKRRWRKRAPAVSPPGRAGANMAFDPIHGVSVLVGGVGPGGVRLTDMWVYDAGNDAWTPLPISAPHRDRAGGGNLLTYDTEDGVLLLKEGSSIRNIWAFRYDPAALTPPTR